MTQEIRSTQTTEAIAARFDALAQQEKWFEIQDELFADNVRSVEPHDSPYFGNAEGKTLVRKKGEDWVARVRDVHRLSTTHPIIAGNHFTVGRFIDITVEGHGRIIVNELMLYKVENGKIVLEQFFY